MAKNEEKESVIPKKVLRARLFLNAIKGIIKYPGYMFITFSFLF